jgi:hypothetical protein
MDVSIFLKLQDLMRWLVSNFRQTESPIYIRTSAMLFFILQKTP